MEEFYQIFHRIEEREKLFDLKDENGFYIWDALRYNVYCQIFQGNISRSIARTSSYSKLFYLKELLRTFFIIIKNRKKKILVISCSRNKKNGEYYDQILDPTIQTIGLNKCLIIDTFGYDNKYRSNGASNICYSLFERFYKPLVSIDDVIREIKSAFSDYPLDKNQIGNSYKAFLSQYYYYRFLFKHTAIKKVLLVQNGICKGLMKAANEIEIELFEFQHGEISFAHPAYSYSQSLDKGTDSIYHPNKLFTFGPFWNSNSYIPGCKNVSLGNDYYLLQSNVANGLRPADVLVVSSIIHGDILSKLVKPLAKERPSVHFYFKLHPNEFSDVNQYREYFKGFDNVEVITNESTCTELLQKVSFTFVIQSTVEFESLSQGVKVIVLEQRDYLALSCLFGIDGLYRIKDENSFYQVYDEHINEVIEPRNDFFEPYNTNVIQDLLT